MLSQIENPVHGQIRRAFEMLWDTQGSTEAKTHVTLEGVRTLRGKLGILDESSGKFPRLDKAKQEIDPNSVDLQALGYHMIGPEWRTAVESYCKSSRLAFEAGGVGAITPGNLPNVSAYLGSVIGLLESKILEGYQMPDMITDKLMPTKPSKTRITKHLGVSWMGDNSGRRAPGQPHVAMQFTDRLVETQETQNDAAKVEVTFEAIFFDQTGKIMSNMNMLGDWLRVRRERDALRVFIGHTNPYKYGGSTYSTYVASGGYWANDIAANKLRDWTSINVVNRAFSKMRDQENDEPILSKFDTIVCSTIKALTAQYIQAATSVWALTQSGQARQEAPRLGQTYEILSSPYLDQILTQSATDPKNPGLALSEAVADDYWWAVNTKGEQAAFCIEENWPVRIQRATPNDYDMLDRGIVLAIFADMMWAPNVMEPRRVIRNKPS